MDKDQKTNYFLIDDVFRPMDPGGSEEEEIEKEGLSEESKEEETKNKYSKKMKNSSSHYLDFQFLL